jgi:hypothetical protein
MRDMTGDQTRFSKYIFNAYFVLAGGIGEEASKEARHVQKSKYVQVQRSVRNTPARDVYLKKTRLLP